MSASSTTAYITACGYHQGYDIEIKSAVCENGDVSESTVYATWAYYLHQARAIAASHGADLVSVMGRCNHK